MTDVTLAAGAALWRPAADGAEVLLVHRQVYDDWSLPKGKSEPGEHLLLTAVREVLEETCVRPVLGPRLPSVEYISWGKPKQVSYWAVAGLHAEAAPGNEIDAVSWLPLETAREQLRDTHDDPVVSALKPNPTIPLILLRHASAGRKQEWAGDDDSRPLDAQGARDAQVLAQLLSCFAPAARVSSSPAVRCTETVRPYSAETGCPVEIEPALARPVRAPSASSRTGPADALVKLVQALVAEHRPAILCLHRENLPTALAAVCAVLGAASALPSEPDQPKGGFWVAHAAGGGLAALESYEP
jgi:8-oxo-dGTP diphosphatase